MEQWTLRLDQQLLNAGDPATGGPITLRVTAFNGVAGDGRSTTLPEVSLAPGQYLYTCDVPFHVDKGMTGVLQITP